MTVKELFEKFNDYVTVDRFKPVENLVFGAVKVVLTLILTAVVYLVIKK